MKKRLMEIVVFDDGEGGVDVAVKVQATVEKQKLLLDAMKEVVEQMEKKLGKFDEKSPKVRKMLMKKGFSEKETEMFTNIREHLDDMDPVQSEIMVHEILAIIQRVKNGR